MTNDNTLGNNSTPDDLVDYFSFLLDSEGYESLLGKIFATTKSVTPKDDGSLIIELEFDKKLVCGPPVKDESLKTWPETFQKIARRHGSLAFPDDGWSLKLVAHGDFDASFLEDIDSRLLGLVDNAEDVLCAITDFSDFWLYHPTLRNSDGEPALCFFDHEGGDVQRPTELNVGALFLARMAQDLDLRASIPELVDLGDTDPRELMNWWAQLPTGWREKITAALASAENLQNTPEEVEITPGKLKVFLDTDELVLNSSEIEDLQPLERFTSLSELYASYSPFTSLRGVETCRSLTFLQLAKAKIDDLSALSPLSLLSKLSLFRSEIASLGSLPELPSLKELDVSDTAIESLNGVEKLPGLRSIELENTAVTSLQPLAGLNDLRTVSIEGCKNLTDLSPLHGKSSLKKLNARNSAITLAEIEALKASIDSPERLSIEA